MKSIIAIFLVFIWMPSVADTSSNKGWRGIVPLRSTRADVERVLGPGANECKCQYYLNDANVLFKYSPGDCKTGRGAWDVPADTVVWITVYPRPNPRLSDLNINKSKFKKGEEGSGDLEYFHNKEEGVTLEVYEGRVRAFIYGPSATDEHLRCSVKDPNIIFHDAPEEFRVPLHERLNKFAEYGRTGKYEQQYELFLPEFAAQMFPTKSKEQYGRWVRSEGIVIEFKPTSLVAVDDDTYGKVYIIYGTAKTSEGGKIVESVRMTKAVIKNGEWYLVDFFRLAPL